MATAFAKNELNSARTRDEDNLFKLGSLRLNSSKPNDGHPMNRRGSMTSLRKNAQDPSLENAGSKVNVLVGNDDLFNKFKSDLSSTGSCTGAGAKAILHNFISQKMDDSHGGAHSSQSVPSTSDPIEPRVGRRRLSMAGLGGKIPRRLSMASLASSLGLDDECVASDSLQASGHSLASSEVLVEFDHTVRRLSCTARRRSSRQMQRQLSSSSNMSELTTTMADAAHLVAAEDDLSDDEKEVPLIETNNGVFCGAQSRRGSMASGRVSCLDSVVAEEKEESSIDDYISDDFSDSDDDSLFQ